MLASKSDPRGRDLVQGSGRPERTGATVSPERLDDHWEDPDVVRRFGEREPDHRLREMVAEMDAPGGLRALDVGCAGGRVGGE